MCESKFWNSSFSPIFVGEMLTMEKQWNSMACFAAMLVEDGNNNPAWLRDGTPSATIVTGKETYAAAAVDQQLL